MNGKPWASGPGEILKHGLSLLENDSDTNRRLALISIDNAVELMVKTYLGLPKRITGLPISRKRMSEIGESFPSLLDGLEEFATDKLDGIDLGEIEWYHRLRNQMYHDGNGLTVEIDKVRVYAELARGLFGRLFDYEIISNRLLKEEGKASTSESINAYSENPLSNFLNTWTAITNIVPPSLLSKLVQQEIIDDTIVQEYRSLQSLRNKIVHGKVKSEDVLDAEQIENVHDLEKKLSLRKEVISYFRVTQQIELDSHRAEQPRLRENMERIKDRLDILAKGESSHCPLCGQELNSQHQENIIQELQNEGQLLGERYRTNQARIQELKALLQNQPEDLEM